MTKPTPEEIERRVEEIVRQVKYEGYLMSPAWQRKRSAKLAESNYACEVCGYGLSDIETAPLDVHHKTYDRFGHEEPDDLEVLCRPCHEERHGRQF